MSKRLRHTILMTLAAFGIYASPALAAVPFDCQQLADISAEDSHTVTSRNIERCMQRGWDPPVSWRPYRGRGAVRVGGGGGFTVLSVQAPDRPPALRGRAASVSQRKMAFAQSFPPWSGFPCELPYGIGNICEGGDGGDGDDGDGDDTGGGTGGENDSSSCTAATDKTGLYGGMQPLSGASNTPVACGGALPLTSYEMTINRDAGAPNRYIASTESGSYYLYHYQGNEGGNFALYNNKPFTLPTYLCRREGKSMKESIKLGAPTAQMIVYHSNNKFIALRMLPTMEQLEEDLDKQLIIPISNGVPQVPENCANQDDYYKRVLPEHAGHLTILAGTESSCEGSGCTGATGGTSTLAASSFCEAVTVYPKPSEGTGSSGSSSSSPDCSKQTQIMIVDRPNLLFPPGSTIRTTPIGGRTALLATTVNGTSLYTASDTLVRIRQDTNFELTEGGLLVYENGAKLAMRGPAIFNGGSITLTNGGTLQSPNGSTVSNFGAGTTVRPTNLVTGAKWPVQVRLNRNIKLPAGYLVPTQANPYVRTPITEP